MGKIMQIIELFKIYLATWVLEPVLYYIVDFCINAQACPANVAPFMLAFAGQIFNWCSNYKRQ